MGVEIEGEGMVKEAVVLGKEVVVLVRAMAVAWAGIAVAVAAGWVELKKEENKRDIHVKFKATSMVI